MTKEEVKGLLLKNRMDAEKTGEMIDDLRFKFGFKYQDACDLWCEATGEEPADFEELMQRYEEICDAR